MDDFKKYLGISFDHISPLLMSPRLKEKYLGFASNLPDAFAHSLFGFEKNLADNTSSMDMCVSSAGSGDYRFCNAFQYPGIAEYVVQNQEWKRLKEFAYEWSSEKGRLNNKPEVIILEIDADSLDEAVPVPSVFFGIESTPGSNKPGYDEIISERLNSFIYSVEIVSGRKAETSIKNKLEQLSELLSGSFHIFQVGLMLSRINSPLKICIKSFNSKNLPDFITRILPGNCLRDELTRITEQYAGYFDELVLALDIHGGEIKRAGIECYFRNKRQPPGEKRWEQVFNVLIKDGFCSKELAAAISGFPRKVRMYRFSEHIPEYYAQGFHHIKFVTDGIKTSAKIYFWGGFKW